MVEFSLYSSVVSLVSSALATSKVSSVGGGAVSFTGVSLPPADKSISKLIN